MDNALLMRYVVMCGRQLCIYIRWFCKSCIYFVRHLVKSMDRTVWMKSFSNLILRKGFSDDTASFHAPSPRKLFTRSPCDISPHRPTFQISCRTSKIRSQMTHLKMPKESQQHQRAPPLSALNNSATSSSRSAMASSPLPNSG